MFYSYKLVTKIADFEGRDIENATEYLKFRLQDKQAHFDHSFYNKRLPEADDREYKVVRKELVKSSWNAEGLPVNWSRAYEEIDLKKYGYY